MTQKRDRKQGEIETKMTKIKGEREREMSQDQNIYRKTSKSPEKCQNIYRDVKTSGHAEYTERSNEDIEGALTKKITQNIYIFSARDKTRDKNIF